MRANHSLVAPSSAAIWGPPEGCRGSILAQLQFPEDNTESAREGDAVHELGFELVDHASRGHDDLENLRPKYVGSFKHREITCNDEMFSAARLYADDVQKVMRSTHVFGGLNLGIEESIASPSIHPDSWGTTDCFIVSGRRLFVWDLKYGFLLVEAFENWQLMNYVAGLLDRFGLWEGPDVELSLRIVQPRQPRMGGPIRIWETTRDAIRHHLEQLHISAHEALSPNPQTRSGPHCRYCLARVGCDAFAQAGAAILDYAGSPVIKEPTPAQVSTELMLIERYEALLKYRRVGLEEHAKTLLRRGKRLPHHKLVTSMGDLSWDAPPEAVVVLGASCGVDLAKPPSPITPTQAIKAGVPKEVVDSVASRKKKGTVVVPDDNKRARKLFGGKNAIKEHSNGL